MRLKRLSNKENKIYIFGENHSNLSEIKEIQEEIKKIKPDIALFELMYEDEVWSKEDAKERLSNCKEGELCDPALNKDLYELAFKLDIPCIGIDLDIKDTKKSLKEKFQQREKHMVEMIKDYMVSGKIVVIVGDTHLRTIETEELGDISLIQKEFSNSPNVVIKRSKNKEIQ